MDDYTLNDVAREYGMEDDFYDDSGIGFLPQQDFGQRNGAPNSPFYDALLNEYENEQNLGNEYAFPHIGFQHMDSGRSIDQYSEEVVEEAQSSDGHSAVVSSPSPVNPRRKFLGPGSQTVSGWQSNLQPTPQNNYRNTPSQSAYMQLANSQRPQHSAIDSPNTEGSRGSNPRNTHGIKLRPVSQLPDIYRGIFKFGVFNAMQSKCFDTIMQSDENMVVSAPTGGGKTVLFELALIKMLMTTGQLATSKCIYVAPTKALCSERYRDWSSKFDPLSIHCCEMTGDTVSTGKSAWSEAKNSRIIITTSEKWDSLTRSWHDHGDFLKEIQLFLVDEVHILNESRGSTLEVVISRMKTLATGVRFLLVSATVPNIRDIAEWIGNPRKGTGSPAVVYEFGEEFRPCRITRHVFGFPRKNQNDFQFSHTLDFKLYPIIQQHASGKPMLIFCSTRKGVMSTGEQLLKEYEQSLESRQTPPWAPPRHLNVSLNDKRLDKLAKAGVGIHHAGLNFDDRRIIEDLFLNGSLRVVVATSTLAVGVNLPAHTVIIKGVKMFQTSSWKEYSDLDIVQMIGRAGRPQFDKEGVAIIMCEKELENKYRRLVQGTTVLESSLHENISEHINSEIGIGTITNMQSAKEWLRNSFLRQRIEKNPCHYQMGKGETQTWEERLDDIVLQSIRQLEANQLISTKGEETNAELSVTEYGEIMSKYYIRQTTGGQISNILKLPERATVREILETISAAEELGDVRLRGGDKQVYGKMRDHSDIKYKIKKIEKASDKAFILIQAVLGGISLSAPEYKAVDSQPALDALTVFRHTTRIARVVVEVAIVKKNGAQLKHGLELVRCLTAKAWEDRPVVLKQIDSIGEKSLKVLAEHGITSFPKLREQNPARIELLLNRRTPFGHEVLAFVNDLPIYKVSIEEENIDTYSGEKPINVDLNITCGIINKINGKLKASKNRVRSLGMTSILTTTSDLDFIDFRRISTKALKETRSFSVSAELSKPSQTVCVLISSENYAGLSVVQSYKPRVASTEFPTLNTRPRSSLEYDLEGLEDDPDFWNNMMDDDENMDDLSATREPAKNENLGSNSTLLGTLDSSKVKAHKEESRVLPNGNFACNHNCKDKTKCRHLCCREGLPKPPQSSKTTVNEQSTPGPKSKAIAKKSSDYHTGDSRLRKLEALHKSTGVNKSLKLPEGKRIKLDDKPSVDTKPKPKKKIDFDVKFTELEDYKEASPEDLPDSQQLLASITARKSGKTKDSSKNISSPPSTDYSNPEFDAIIRSIDTDAMGCEMNKRSQPEKLPGKRKYLGDLSDNTPNEKGTHRSVDDFPAAKKQKVDSHSSSSETRLFLSSPRLLSHRPGSLADTPDFDARVDEEDPFTLNSSLFEIVPSHNADRHEPEDKIDRYQESNKTGEHGLSENIAQLHSRGNQIVQDELKQATPKEENKVDDDWADFEDWLKSGAVKIVESQD